MCSGTKNIGITSTADSPTKIWMFNGQPLQTSAYQDIAMNEGTFHNFTLYILQLYTMRCIMCTVQCILETV